jgi:hypothetical protein
MHRYLSTPPIFSAPVTSIDRDNGIIRGVTIAPVGPAKGHDGFVDKTFLLQLVENAASKAAGIKARFGHPNMCTTALGTYLGRFKNFSYANYKVNADLYLDNTARNTPSGDLFNYVLDMAERNPDMFGASIVFEIAESVFLTEDKDGKKVKNEYFRLKELRATDIVDEPAATDGLFSANTFPGIATQFLDENPQILELIFSKPDSIVEFLSNYLTNSKMNLSSKIKENFAAFLAAFSEKPDAVEPSDSLTLNTLYDSIWNSYPELIAMPADCSSDFQKAEGLTSFITAMHDKAEEISLKNEESIAAFNSLNDEHQALLTSSGEISAELQTSKKDLEAANSRILELTEQLSARPSIPLNVTDPALSLSTNQEKDETGKHILAALPKDLKRKLK